MPKGLTEKVVMQGLSQKVRLEQTKESWFIQMSNAFDSNSLPQSAEKERNKAPTDFVHTIPKAEFSEETRSLKQVMVEQPEFNFVAGAQTAEGKEKGLGLSRVEVFHCPWRIPFKMFNGRDPESNMSRFLIKAGLKTTIANQATTDLRDLFYQQSLIEGSCETLNQDKYWVDHENTDFQTAPLTVKMHPNIFYRGMTTPPTRVPGNLATDKANLNAAFANMTASSIMDLAAVKRIINIGRTRFRPMKMSGGGKKYSYVLKLTQYQAEQLQADPEWIAVNKDADARGPENRALTGVIGNIWDTMISVDQKGPVWRLDDASVLFMRPSTKTTSTTIEYFTGAKSLDRVVKGGAGVATGTCEIAVFGGAGAIIHPQPIDFEFDSRDFDYNFRQGFCAMSIEGMQRPEWTRSDGTVYNETSMLYLTATPAMMA